MLAKTVALSTRDLNYFTITKLKGNGHKNIYYQTNIRREISQEQQGIIKKGSLLLHAEFNLILHVVAGLLF